MRGADSFVDECSLYPTAALVACSALPALAGFAFSHSQTLDVRNRHAPPPPRAPPRPCAIPPPPLAQAPGKSRKGSVWLKLRASLYEAQIGLGARLPPRAPR